jgi:hypothetical protein
MSRHLNDGRTRLDRQVTADRGDSPPGDQDVGRTIHIVDRVNDVAACEHDPGIVDHVFLVS